MAKPVPERLADLASIYAERNAIYGDDFRRYGRVMMALFPAGVVVTNERDANRLGILTQMVAKFGRYCANFNAGGHPDSLDDLAVYSQILSLVDDEARETPFPGDGIVRPEFLDPNLSVTRLGDTHDEDMVETCYTCGGSGKLSALFGPVFESDCPHCNGTGKAAR